jgi:predicted GNAT superfamily acetyltransferase
VGIRRITWTFDPMQAGNAHLNLALLGATVREYVSNFYGVTTSALHHGLPTDRLLASWALQSLRVAALSRGEPVTPLSPQAAVDIPKHWNELVGREPDQARIEQQRVEKGLRAAFARGLVATSFDKARTEYVLTSPEPQ